MDFKILEKSPRVFKLRIFHPEFSRFALIVAVGFLILGILVTIILVPIGLFATGAILGSSIAFFFSLVGWSAFLTSSYDNIILINPDEGIVQRDIYYRVLRATKRQTVPLSTISRVYFATDARSASCTLKLETTSNPKPTNLFFAVPLPEFKQWQSYFRELFPAIPFTSEEFQAGYELRAL